MQSPKPKAEVIPGVGPDSPTVVNERGGKQSRDLYRLDLVPQRGLLAVGKVLAEGAEKYGVDNWRKIDRWSHLNKALIHVYAYLAGDRTDEHLEHAACRLLMALDVPEDTR